LPALIHDHELLLAAAAAAAAMRQAQDAYMGMMAHGPFVPGVETAMHLAEAAVDTALRACGLATQAAQ
jgi:hypothetical protein